MENSEKTEKKTKSMLSGYWDTGSASLSYRSARKRKQPDTYDPYYQEILERELILSKSLPAASPAKNVLPVPRICDAARQAVEDGKTRRAEKKLKKEQKPKQQQQQKNRKKLILSASCQGSGKEKDFGMSSETKKRRKLLADLGRQAREEQCLDQTNPVVDLTEQSEKETYLLVNPTLKTVTVDLKLGFHMWEKILNAFKLVQTLVNVKVSRALEVMVFEKDVSVVGELKKTLQKVMNSRRYKRHLLRTADVHLLDPDNPFEVSFIIPGSFKEEEVEHSKTGYNTYHTEYVEESSAEPGVDEKRYEAKLKCCSKLETRKLWSQVQHLYENQLSVYAANIFSTQHCICQINGEYYLTAEKQEDKASGKTSPPKNNCEKPKRHCFRFTLTLKMFGVVVSASTFTVRLVSSLNVNVSVILIEVTSFCVARLFEEMNKERRLLRRLTVLLLKYVAHTLKAMHSCSLKSFNSAYSYNVLLVAPDAAFVEDPVIHRKYESCLRRQNFLSTMELMSKMKETLLKDQSIKRKEQFHYKQLEIGLLAHILTFNATHLHGFHHFHHSSVYHINESNNVELEGTEYRDKDRKAVPFSVINLLKSLLQRQCSRSENDSLIRWVFNVSLSFCQVTNHYSLKKPFIINSTSDEWTDMVKEKRENEKHIKDRHGSPTRYPPVNGTRAIPMQPAPTVIIID